MLLQYTHYTTGPRCFREVLHVTCRPGRRSAIYWTDRWSITDNNRRQNTPPGLHGTTDPTHRYACSYNPSIFIQTVFHNRSPRINSSLKLSRKLPLSVSILGDFAYWYRCYRSVVCLSVCLAVMFVHCAQTAEDIDTISFAASIATPCLSNRVKIWLTSVNPFLPKFCAKVTHPMLIWAAEKFDGKLQPND